MSTITTQAGRAVKASRLRWRGAGRTAHESQESHQSHHAHPETSDAPAAAGEGTGACGGPVMAGSGEGPAERQ